MSSDKETTDYSELRPGDRVQVGDQWLDQFGQWHFYTHAGNTGGFVNSGVKARRPIPATHQATYEELPGSRTTQGTVVQWQRERIAYEELRPGDVIQEGDEHCNADGRWHAYDLSLCGSRVHGAWDGRARRPYRISTILEIGDALASAQKATAQVQDERDKWQRQVAAERSASEVAIAERNEAERLLAEVRMERDKARSDQKAIQAYRDTVLQELGNAEQALSEERAAHTQTRNERDRLQGLINDLLDEPTAKQVQDMLRTWATELDWSAGCFDSVGRDEIDTIQKTLVAVIERVESIINPEGNTDGN